MLAQAVQSEICIFWKEKGSGRSREILICKINGQMNQRKNNNFKDCKVSTLIMPLDKLFFFKTKPIK